MRDIPRFLEPDLNFIAYLLAYPVKGPGTRLVDHPGVYPDRGIALVVRAGFLVIALELDVWHQRMSRNMEPWPAAAREAWSPKNLLVSLQHSPFYFGQLTGEDFAGGRWHGLAALPVAGEGAPKREDHDVAYH